MGGGAGGVGRPPPRKFLEFMTQKDAFLRPFSPFFLCNFRRISMRRGGEGGGGRPPAKIFEGYNPKRCIFKAFSPFFSSLFLSLFLFFFPNSSISFFSPASHFPPPLGRGSTQST